MKLLREVLRHPVVLLGAVLLGAWTGVLWPQGGALFGALSGIYLSLIQAVALPFLVLAVYFALQCMASAGWQWRRMAMLAVLALAVMLACALGGALLTSVSAAGAGMDPDQQAALGRLAMQRGAPEVSLRADPAEAQAAQDAPALVPHNLYAVMAFGAAPSVLIGVLLFGAAVAVQQREQADHLNAILDAVKRAMELAIGVLNTGLPLIAFVLAAAAASAAGPEPVALLASFLATWFGAVLLAGAAAVALLAWRGKTHPWQVLTALREPVTVCLLAPVGAAALPEFIEALSVRLGFSRAVVELLASVCPVFVRTGEALFFAVLAVFIANVYGRPPGAVEIVSIGLLSCSVALGSVGVPGVKVVLWAGVLQQSLGLPLDAMLPVLLMVDALCEGARNLVSYLAAAVLVAAGSDLLDLQKATAGQAAAAPAPIAPLAPLVLVLPRRQALLGLVLAAGALLSVFCAGLGAGLRKILLTTF
ncbi:MAG TPA: cation:dicarboxylase symporter family transporter [Telluria sp.]|jgi:Na+/H+-dicarboxylate symporter